MTCSGMQSPFYGVENLGLGTCRLGSTLSEGAWYCLRGVEKIRRLTQLATRYAHQILSLFNIVSCNWNVLGPAFLQSSDSVIEELLFLVLQSSHLSCNTNTNGKWSGWWSSSNQHFGWQPVLELTCELVRCPGSKWLLFDLNWKNSWTDTKVSDDEDIICTTNQSINQYIYNARATVQIMPKQREMS